MNNSASLVATKRVNPHGGNVGSSSSRPLRNSAPAGVIETLGHAFTLLNRRPHFILFLVGLECFLWLGPRIHPSSLVATLLRYVDTTQSPWFEQSGTLETWGNQFNVLLLLSTVVPTLVAALGTENLAVPLQPLILYPNPPIAALTLIAFLGLGVVLGISYWTLLATVVRGERLRWREFGSATVRNSGIMLSYFLLLFLGASGLALLTGGVLMTAALLGIDTFVASALVFFFFVGGFFFYVVTFFVENAIVLSRAGPFRAVMLSVGILRVSPGASLRFIAASSIVQLGLPLALRVFTHQVLAMPFAILSHAYIISGLLLASLLFYRERVALVLRREHQQSVVVEE